MRGGAIVRPIGGAYTLPTNSLNTFEMNTPIIIKRPATGSNRIQPGNGVYYPQYNSSELAIINKSSKLLSPSMQGGLNWGDVGNFFKGATSKILDIAAPALGSYAAGPAGAEVASLARNKFKDLTGLGRIKSNVKIPKQSKGKIIHHKNPKIAPPTANRLKVKRVKVKKEKIDSSKAPEPIKVTELISALTLDDKSDEIPKAAGVGNFEKLTKGGKIKLPKVPKIKKVKEPKVVDTTKPKKTNERMLLVKNIMKEKNLNLPQASKYIKDNNLYQKK